MKTAWWRKAAKMGGYGGESEGGYSMMALGGRRRYAFSMV